MEPLQIILFLKSTNSRPESVATDTNQMLEHQVSAETVILFRDMIWTKDETFKCYRYVHKIYVSEYVTKHNTTEWK